MSSTDDTIAAGPFEASWESLKNYSVPAWYQDAKFGIFIHWGVYSVPAFGSEWYPRNMYQAGSPENLHHIKTYGPVDQFGYKDFIPKFGGENFDPEAWAELFQEAGARYVVPVAEHHDGFAMYDSDLTEWTAVKMGPKRNTTGLLGEAVRKRGMTFGVSNHRAENWWYFNGGRLTPSDVTDPANQGLYGRATLSEDGAAGVGKSVPDTAHAEDWLARACEMVDKLRPQIMYYDWWINEAAFAPYLQKFAAYYYNRAAEWGLEVAINYKEHAYPEGCAVYDIERGQLAGINPRFWQTDTALGKKSWGYIVGEDYKTPASVVGDLVDIASKNGTLLINVGPKPDGTIPDEDAAILRSVGAWLKVNGEAIYGTRPWTIFGEGPTEVPEGGFSDTKRPAFTAEDIRFTTRGETLYAIALAVPGASLTIKSLGTDAGLRAGKIGRVRLLGHDAPLAWNQTAEGLTVTLPAHKPSLFASALEITPA